MFNARLRGSTTLLQEHPLLTLTRGRSPGASGGHLGHLLGDSPWLQGHCVSASPGSQGLLKPLLCSKLQSLMSQQRSNEKDSSGNTPTCYPQKRHAMQLQLVKHHLQTAQHIFCVHAPAITLKRLSLSQRHKEMV